MQDETISLSELYVKKRLCAIHNNIDRINDNTYYKKYTLPMTNHIYSKLLVSNLKVKLSILVLCRIGL
jgi:hypothetical protein